MKGYEGISAIQYSVLYGNIRTIELFIQTGAILDNTLEGIPILDLSLSLASKQFYFIQFSF